jgi:hypothetical protein
VILLSLIYCLQTLAFCSVSFFVRFLRKTRTNLPLGLLLLRGFIQLYLGYSLVFRISFIK